MKLTRIGLLLLIVSLFISSGLSAREPVKEMTGAGASFPYPLYSKWFNVYAKTHGVEVNYQSIGSGGGIRQLQNRTVDFGASDAFLTKKDQEKFKKDVLHIPTALGGVSVVYNMDTEEKIKLTPDIVSDIFLGKIKTWRNKRIKAINPEINLPNLPIIVVHRSDGSGTTFIFTDYLSKVSDEWKNKVGAGKSVRWPSGIGGKGNEGVAGSVKNLPGSIGYVEVIYAEKNDLNYALIKNKSGNFVAPTLQSISQAADVELPEDMRVSITNTDADKGYPISGFTWLLVFQEQHYNERALEQAKAVKSLLVWALTDAQQYNEKLLYAQLPTAAKKKAMKLVQSMTFKGEPIKLNQ